MTVVLCSKTKLHKRLRKATNMLTSTPVHTLSTQPIYDVAIVGNSPTHSPTHSPLKLTTMLRHVSYDVAYEQINHWRRVCNSLHTRHVIVNSLTDTVVFDSNNVLATNCTTNQECN